KGGFKEKEMLGKKGEVGGEVVEFDVLDIEMMEIKGGGGGLEKRGKEVEGGKCGDLRLKRRDWERREWGWKKEGWGIGWG
ncbi:hypothetical protein, partial [Neisseria sicca]|uniref:hypothetical protein n=1 Tax=Neisseria sicca TaxID=490 RepID=UPI001649D1F0